MVVKFGSTNKRHNSTLQPVMDVEYSCTLKEGCSILTPTIKLAKDPDVLKGKNCAYIPSFRRFYWMRDIRIVNAVTYIDLDVDVLATYKLDIGNSDLYITRSSAESDEFLPDNLYPTTEAITSTNSMVRNLNLDASILSSIVVGVISTAGIKYYALNLLAVDAFFQKILSKEFAQAFIGSMMDTANQNLALMVDPLQYIESIRFYPFGISGTPSSITIGTQTVAITSGVCDVISSRLQGLEMALKAPSIHHIITHPQAEQRGKYLNAPPFTEAYINTPFGMHDINISEMNQEESVTSYLDGDVFTGVGRFHIEGASGNIYLDVVGKLGVELPIAQVVKGGMDYISAVGNVLNAGLSGNVIGAIGSGVSAIGNAVANSIPKARSTGSYGSCVEIVRGINILYTFHMVADDFNADRGRPLCKVRKPKDIPGYVMASNPDVAILGTREESEQVNSMLEAGIFYE